MTDRGVSPQGAEKSDLVYCPACRRTASGLGPGPGGRPNVVCPHCGSLDRHRVMALMTELMIARAPPSSIILDVAPSIALSDLIRNSSTQTYVSIDFDPEADGRSPDVRASITQLPLHTGSVGFLLCSHVLEHVPDDRSAILELARVLGPEAATLIQVPRRRGFPTDEDLALSSDGRLERYGQTDHVRLYGDDFEERLESASLKVMNTSYTKLLPKPLLETIGVSSDHELWVATTGADPAKFLDPDALMRTLARSLAFEADTWRSNYEWLRNRFMIRAAAATKTGAAALLSAIRVRGDRGQR